MNKPVYFQRNIENIVAIANYRNIKVVLASFAYSDFGQEEAEKLFKQSIDETNQILQDVSKSTNAYFFDFAEYFPRDDNYFTDGIHVNEEGAELKAELFANFLVKNNLL
ncbi:MAG: hypothetical protein P9L88_01525 [Candidatus Tantalella remota]|nr:hypothetical protein [Candidatus Tantalella remota]